MSTSLYLGRDPSVEDKKPLNDEKRHPRLKSILGFIILLVESMMLWYGKANHGALVSKQQQLCGKCILLAFLCFL